MELGNEKIMHLKIIFTVHFNGKINFQIQFSQYDEYCFLSLEFISIEKIPSLMSSFNDGKSI